MEDKLNRMPIIQNLTEVIEQLQLDRGIVVGIDASWGKGKTTFINLWEKYLNETKKEIYHVIKFNAWDKDDSGNPLVSLIIELEELLIGETKKEVYGFVKELAKGIVPNLVERATCGGVKADDLNILFNAHEMLKYDLIEHEKTRTELKNKLKDSIAELAQEKKIIFFIDELDRCRPLYAIELLETIKHLFNVKNCIFILAWDKVQLSESIKTIYGLGMDSDGYLRRFVDLDYQLPEPSRKNYINYLFEKENITDKQSQIFYEIIPTICDAYNLSLRDIDKLCLNLKINFNRVNKLKLRDNYAYVYSFLKAIFYCIKLKNISLYQKIKNKSYKSEEIHNILLELNILILEERITTHFRGLDEYVKNILECFLQCNIRTNDNNSEEFTVFSDKKLGWNSSDKVNMKEFCNNDYIFNEIEFLENLNMLS